MERDYFIYKSRCEIVIVTDEIAPDAITDELGVTPTRSFRKGEQSVSKHSGSIIVRPHNLWAARSVPTERPDESIGGHLDFFRSYFSSSIELLRGYKENDLFDVTFWVWMETDDVGVGLELDEKEIAFIHSLSNSVHLTVICNGAEQD